MFKKILSAICLSSSIVFLCGFDNSGCDGDRPDTGAASKKEMEQTETVQQRLATTQPPPTDIKISLERKNLIERLHRLNSDEHKIGYVYLLSKGGQIMAFYTIRGKVSSLNSLLTTPQQIVNYCPMSGNCEGHVIDSPDFDGSFGRNPEGIFFFTTSDALVEWSGDYLYSDQPLKITTPIVLVADADKK